MRTIEQTIATVLADLPEWESEGVHQEGDTLECGIHRMKVTAHRSGYEVSQLVDGDEKIFSVTYVVEREFQLVEDLITWIEAVATLFRNNKHLIS